VQAREPASEQDSSEHTILVVDDDKPTREAISEMLSSLNYRTLLAEDGQEALKILQDPPQPISLVLTDLVMPKVGGAELLERLRAMKQEIPLVLMTSYPLGTEPQELLGNGLVGWLEKPLTESTLGRTIRSVLKQGRHS
jgi:CheY-like chemotaxis protein